MAQPSAVTFRDEKIQKKFSKNGFIVLDWLNPTQLNQLVRNFNNQKVSVSGFMNSMNYPDLTFSRNSSELILKLFSEKAYDLLPSFKPLIGSYAAKATGTAGKISLHQDWSVVDEEKHTSINIWCALEDMDKNNGCMSFLRGSHKQPYTIRGSKLNKVYFPKKHGDIMNYWLSSFPCEYIELRAGQAVIYDQRVVHFSTENLRKKTRLAAGMLMTPHSSKTLHYSFDEEGQVIKRFEVDENFFFDIGINGFDLNRLKDYTTIPISRDDFSIIDQQKHAVYPDEIGLANRFRRLITR